jgi:flagellar basal-body rod modification protein FlgD
MSTSTDYGVGSSTAYQREQAEKTATGRGKVTHTDFLKLLTKQLTSQDPLNPQQDIDFTAQLAQLQALEEQMSMTKTMQGMRIDTQVQAATAMIDKYISGTSDAGKTVTGMVDRMVQQDGEIYVELTDKSRIAVSGVTNVWSDASSMYQEISNGKDLLGMWVEGGVDKAGQPIRGIVEKVEIVNGMVQLKLFGGQSLSMNALKEVREPTTDEIYYTLPDDVRTKVENAQKLGKAYVQSEQADGSVKSGIVVSSELDPATLKVYLVLQDGSKMDIDSLTEDPRTPTANEAADKLAGLEVTGLDEQGNEITGIVVGATDNEDGLSLTLKDGKTVYWDTVTTLGKPKEETENPDGGTGG